MRTMFAGVDITTSGAGPWLYGKCGGPGVRVLIDGSFEVDGRGRPSQPVNALVNGFEPLIRKWSDVYGVPAHVIAGVMMRESQGRQNIVSFDGGYGLMQLTSSAAKAGHSNDELLSDASLNIQLGTKYLGQLWKDFGGNPIHAITSYNAGSVKCSPGRNVWNLVNTYSQPPVPAQDYVGGVLTLANGALDGAFAPKAAASDLSSVALAVALGATVGYFTFDWARTAWS